MGRRAYNHLFGPVADYPVAEHRYRWDREDDTFPETYKEVKAAAPYKPGEVVYVVYGDTFRKAIIVDIFCYVDYYGDLREHYRVLPETKEGTWSKLYYTTYPGHIQRGYQRAGLAPEMPNEKE